MPACGYRRVVAIRNDRRNYALSVAAYLPDAAMKWPVGTRIPIGDNTLAAVLQRSGRPVRMDTYDNATGTLPELVRAIGLRAAVGVPVTSTDACGAWRPARTGQAPGRPTPRPT